MSNPNLSKHGFRYIGSRYGSGPPHVERVRVASAYQASAGGSVNLWPGDPVKKVSDGTIALCAAGEPVYGVIWAVMPYLNSSGIKDFGESLPGATAYTAQADASMVLIIPAAGNLFEVDCDDTASGYDTEAEYVDAIGENADHVFTRDATRLAACPMLDISQAAAADGTANGQWRIVDIGRSSQQDFASANVKVIVTGNEVQEAPHTTVGI